MRYSSTGTGCSGSGGPWNWMVFSGATFAWDPRLESEKNQVNTCDKVPPCHFSYQMLQNGSNIYVYIYIIDDALTGKFALMSKKAAPNGALSNLHFIFQPGFPLPWRIRVQSDGRRTGWIWGLRKDQVKCCSGPMHLQIMERGRAREFPHKNCFQSSWMVQSPIPSPIDWLQRAAIVLLCFYKTCNLSLFFMLCLFLFVDSSQKREQKDLRKKIHVYQLQDWVRVYLESI